MTGARLLQPSFAGGEMDPALHGRVDLQRYGTSLKTAINYIVRPSGGLEARGGSIFCGELKDSDQTVRLIGFVVSRTVAYVIELGEGYARFYLNDALIESSPGVAHEIVVPYTEAELPDIALTQSADVMYLVHNNHKPQQIGRMTATEFVIANYVNRGGPFRATNADKAQKMTASAATGNIIITSNFDIFTAAMVGSLIRLEEKALGEVRPWVQGERVTTVDTMRRSEGKVYRASTIPSGGSYHETGNVRPLHDTGREWDGPGDTRSISGGVSWSVGVEWEYMHSGYGIAEITGYTSPTQVSAIVKLTMPEGVVGGFGTAINTWTPVGDGVTTVFPIVDATHPSADNYTVTFDGSPVSD